MRDGRKVKVEDIQKGDTVVTFHIEKDENGQYHESYNSSKIECVIRTQCENHTEKLIHIGNLLVLE